MDENRSSFYSERHTDGSLLRNETLRLGILFLLIMISIGYYFFQKSNLEDKLIQIESTDFIPDDLSALLLNRPYFIEKTHAHIPVPDSILEFVDFSDMFIQKTDFEKSNHVVIYEIVDQLDNEKKIDFFLTEAKELLRTDKLTTPRGNSAADKYYAVLAMDPKNTIAIEGIKKIVDRYLVLTDEAIRKKQNYKVTSYIKKAFLVGDEYLDMSLILNKYKSYLDDKSVFIQSSDYSEKSAVIADVESIDIIVSDTRSIQDIDIDFAKLAAERIKNNDFMGAKKILLRFTEISSYWGQSYNQLFTLYIRDSAFEEAKDLINASPLLGTYELAEKVARLFVANNDKSSAILLLESHSPDLKRYPELYALKAALYYQLGRFEDGASVYKKLIALDHTNARYWIGLALSFDAMSDNKTLAAFEFAGHYFDGNTKVEAYLEQRILTLNLSKETDFL